MIDTKFFTKILAISAFTISGNFAIYPASMAQGVSFLCTPNQDGHPTTVARTAQGDVPIIVWATEKGGGYTPQKRCEIVSAKFQDFHGRGILKYMTTGRENRQNVICVTDKQDGTCLETLYTISDQTADPGLKLQQLLDVRLQASGPISETNGRIYIDMNQYLQDATAAGLIIPNNNFTPSQPSSLNTPDPFNSNPPENNRNSTPSPLW